MRHAEMLLDLSLKLPALDTLDEVLHALIEATTRETGSERGSLFLDNPVTGELYTRVTQGGAVREIRILRDSGIAGWVFTSGESRIIDDVYKEPHFNASIDQQTGFKTRNMLCVPIRTVRGEIIGVIQVLNKRALNKGKGRYSREDLAVVEAITTQAAAVLQNTQYIERMQKRQVQELAFLDVVADLTSEIDLTKLLKKVMAEATRMLSAERSTLFLNDPKTGELWSTVGEGLESTVIRLPNHAGIAGAVFTSGQAINIPYAYADLRFNPSFDKRTGFFTRSILCVPVVNKQGAVIGVTQVLNKKGGAFTPEDEQRLKAFTAQISIGLENAKLFNDVQNMKSYNESMLESMSNGVVTLDEDEKIVTCNAAGMRILGASLTDLAGRPAAEFLSGENAWIMDKIHRVNRSQISDITVDANMRNLLRQTLSVNLTVLPLVSGEGEKLGTMVMFEDISSEKRMKSTMSRYMDPGVADQLLAAGQEVLGGKEAVATVLFCDIRSFTTLAESLGPQSTVSVLNEYFSIMVDECISPEGGMLDKFIGDAIMAAFGIPVSHGDDEDRAVRAAIHMIAKLREWNEVRVRDGKPVIANGIGLNTGNIVSGNIGSPKRMDYTMIGDGVNLAARLETACKQYSSNLLISEFTYQGLKGTYRIRDIDDVIVMGKTKPVRIYEVLDYHSADTFPNLMDNVSHFREGRQHFIAGNWDRAVRSFGECLKATPSDKLAEIYVERCAELKARDPQGWTGVWVMQTK